MTLSGSNESIAFRYPWAALRFAHGYCRSAFQATSEIGYEAAKTDTGPLVCYAVFITAFGMLPLHGKPWSSKTARMTPPNAALLGIHAVRSDDSSTD